MRPEHAAHPPSRAPFSPRTDRQAARKFASKLLAQTMAELEHFVHEDGARVNPNRWKALATRETLQLHRERDHVSLNSPTRSLLVSGRLRGRVENALFAASSESLEQLALLNAFIFGDTVVDSAVVASLEPPPPLYVSDGKPHRDDWLLDACILSVKSLSKRGKSARGSDDESSVQYLEYNGFTRRPKSGELVGFYLLSPSADVSSSACEPSVRCLYRQLHNDVIDVYLLASGDISRANTSSRSSSRGFASSSAWSSLITTDALFNIANLLECAEVKRLTIMMRENRQALQSKRQTNDPDVIALLESTAAKKRSACGVCQRKKKIFHAFTSCDVCSQTVCTRCRLQRRVFVPRFDANGTGTSGGFFQKIAACKPCVMLATTGGGRQPRALSIMPTAAQQQPEAVGVAARPHRTCGKSERFRIQSTSTPRAFDRRVRTDSNGSASSMPTPHGSKATPKGGIRLFSYHNDDSRDRKHSSASDTGHWSFTTPRGGGNSADWKHHEQQQQLRQQQERFPRFGPAFNAATTPGSTRSKEPMGFAIPAENECPDAPPAKYASQSLPSTPSSSSTTQSWSTTASSAAASPSNLMQRMIELRKLAEISYDTTRRNNDMMTQHRR